MIAVENSLDRKSLELQVKEMYKNVALNPFDEYHFEMGRKLALRLGYLPAELDTIPSEAVDSFAGVGYHLSLAAIHPGDRVLDLGSGSGTDAFIAALLAGPMGTVTGIDMTDEQLNKSTGLAARFGIENVTFVKGYIENLPFHDSEFDVVISNGVINLSPEKEKIFNEISRVLKKGGRLAISDIVTESQLPENVTCNASLWAACIGGASQEDDYFNYMNRAGLKKFQVIHNTQYQFISKSAVGASRKYGVKSMSIRCDKL